MIKEITVKELKTQLDEGNKPYLLDVREDHELEIAKLDLDKHIPLGELQDEYEDLDPNVEMVVYCRSGGRSLKACEFLKDRGFENVKNLKGGVLAWADEVDPNMKKY